MEWAFVAVGRDGIRLTSGILASLRAGSAQALLLYHRASSLKLDSVPDTYQKAIASLQLVTRQPSLVSYNVGGSCNKPERPSAAVKHAISTVTVPPR